MLVVQNIKGDRKWQKAPTFAFPTTIVVSLPLQTKSNSFS